MKNPVLSIGDIVLVTRYADERYTFWCIVSDLGDPIGAAAFAIWLCGDVTNHDELLLERDRDADTYTVPDRDKVPDKVWQVIGERALTYAK